MNRKQYCLTVGIIFFLFLIGLYLSGYFSVGLISDDYYNLFDATNTSFLQKFSGKLPFTNILHLRPIYYLSIQSGYAIHNLLGLGFDNFINFRIGNLLLFLLLSIICGELVFLLSRNYFLSILTVCSVILFPSNIHNICWTAGRVDILCGIFYITFLFYSFKYIVQKRRFHLYLSIIFLVCALLTKESSITAFPLLILLILYFKGKNELIKFSVPFIIYLVIIFAYLGYKFLLAQLSIPNSYGESGFIVLIKSFLGLILPEDFLTIQYQFRENNISILVYFMMFIGFSFLYFLYLIQNKFFKIVFFAFIISLLTVSPYVIAGYVRPQILLIPFIILVIFLTSSVIYSGKQKKYQFKRSVYITYLFILIYWATVSFQNVHQWKFAYEYSKANLDNFSSVNYDKTKYTIILGNPGRLNQVFMFDKITGPYNYWKYKEPVIKDTLYDIVLTGGLDINSIESRLNYKLIDEKNCEISTGSENQFFYIEGYEIDKNRRLFENEKVKIEFAEFNYVKKPTKMNVTFKSKYVDCYLANETMYYKIH